MGAMIWPFLRRPCEIKHLRYRSFVEIFSDTGERNNVTNQLRLIFLLLFGYINSRNKSFIAATLVVMVPAGKLEDTMVPGADTNDGEEEEGLNIYIYIYIYNIASP